MQAKQQAVMVSVRLPQALARRVKSRAAAQGETVQQAVQAALQAWLAQPKAAAEHGVEEFIARWRGSLSGPSVAEMRREENRKEMARDRELFSRGQVRTGQK